MTTLSEAAGNLEAFESGSLTRRLAALESVFRGKCQAGSAALCSELSINAALLDSALLFKRTAGQINVLIHALGILIALPYILEPDETVESLSLGAGNTGRPFDLQTDRRLAEFKFIQWRGGAEAIRQNGLFKDFYELAEYDPQADRQRYLYVVGLRHPLRFLTGGRALASVMSRDNRLWADFQQRYGERFSRVREYYEYRRSQVKVVDITEIVPPLAELLGE